MELKPMVRYAGARYPTRDIIDEQPELLRLMPARWRRDMVILASLTTLCTLIAGCRSTRTGSTVGDGALVGEPMPPPITSHIAPLFQKVEERTTIMGKVAAPKFLSEHDAQLIILEEAKKLGIDFKSNTKTISQVPLVSPPDIAQRHKFLKEVSLMLDGFAESQKLGFEYISQDDYTAMHQNDVGKWAFREQMQDTAQALRDGLAKVKPEGAYATFYDPVIYDDQATREELRQQVRDFISWLKAEGVM